jgi:hypothetical protein
MSPTLGTRVNAYVCGKRQDDLALYDRRIGGIQMQT